MRMKRAGNPNKKGCPPGFIRPLRAYFFFRAVFLAFFAFFAAFFLAMENSPFMELTIPCDANGINRFNNAVVDQSQHLFF
jgi:hypothetical protein